MPLGIPIPFPGLIIRFSSYLFGSVISKFYTKQKLTDLVEIKVCSEPSGITVSCSELPDISVWLEITNLSPFHVIIHEVDADFYLSDRVAKFVKICNKDIGPSGEDRLFIQTDLTVKQVEYIIKHKNVDAPSLKINMMLSCRLSSFEINDRVITTNNIEYKNCDDS